MMTPEQSAAFVCSQAALLNAQIAGMTAENLADAVEGASLRYSEGDFRAATAEYEATLGHNAVMTLFRDVNSG